MYLYHLISIDLQLSCLFNSHILQSLHYKRSYLILKDKLLVIRKYINKYLNKGFICPSILLIATPILLTKKLKGGI